MFLSKLYNRFSDKLKTFFGDRRGNTAIIFALCSVPVLMAAGIAVDVSRSLVVRERLAQALDAAALAAGNNAHLSESELQTLVDNYLAANYADDEMGNLIQVSPTVDGTTVTLTGSAEVGSTIMALFGYEKITIAASTEVTQESSGLEVIMVLDNTGSMRGSKISSLKSAAEDLLDILFGDDTTSSTLKIGLVPFAQSVNIGTDALANGWMDEDGDADIAGENFDFAPGQTVWDLFDEINNRSWNGCVETREPPYDVQDAEPTTSNPNTLWQPYFAPDEPNEYYYDNDYIYEVIGGTYAQQQRNVTKYNNVYVYYSHEGPGENCELSEVTPLTNNKSTLLSAIDDMNAKDFTHIPIGLAWGWRLLSPEQPFNQGVAYTDTDWDKALILLTDGENTINDEYNHNLSKYSAYGYLANARLGTTNDNVFEDKLDENTTTLCNAIKAKGIRVYTITFEVNTNNVRDLMRDCATDPSLYFDSPSSSELDAAFDAIARDLNNLRLSK